MTYCYYQGKPVGKLGSAQVRVEERKQVRDKQEMREEGENSNVFSLHLWFKLSFSIGLN
jgi:hypothetical protein